jgi:hypothetical protein
VKGSTHLRAIVIAGTLAAVALALAFVTFAMNQSTSSAAPPKVILPLHARHAVSSTVSAKAPAVRTPAVKTPAVKPKAKPKKKVVRVDPNLKAALAAGLPRPVAQALASSKVAVVELTSADDSVAQQALAEAEAGAKLGGASFVKVSVDSDSPTLQALTRVLENVPDAPATLVYTRPATLSLSLSGFVDKTVVQQAVTNVLAQIEAGAPTTTTAAPGSA